VRQEYQATECQKVQQRLTERGTLAYLTALAPAAKAVALGRAPILLTQVALATSTVLPILKIGGGGLTQLEMRSGVPARPQSATGRLGAIGGPSRIGGVGLQLADTCPQATSDGASASLPSADEGAAGRIPACDPLRRSGLDHQGLHCGVRGH
jgi:hypothetical protein